MPCLRGQGIEWIVDACGVPAAALRDRPLLESVFRKIIDERGLHPIGPLHWHRFPGTGGLTGLWMLKESHLACHTFPEFAGICFNLFCCRPRPAWPWKSRLAGILRATHVTVRTVRRDYAPVREEASA